MWAVNCLYNFRNNFTWWSFSSLCDTIHEPRHDKTNKWGCAQWRLRSVWASAQSDQSLLCAQWVAKDQSFLHADSEDSDQTGLMLRLIWVFAGRTLNVLVLSCLGSHVNDNNQNTSCGIMSSVWGMILQWGSTIKVSIGLPVATRHRRGMTENLLKTTLKQKKQTPIITETPCDKTNKWPFASKDSDQPGHPPESSLCAQ